MNVVFNKKMMVGLFAASMAVASYGALAASVPVTLSVTFTGNIKNNTCDTPTVSGSGTVAFGTISQSAFSNTVGYTGDTKDFTVTFTNCGNDTTGVNVWFAGTTTNSVHAVDNSGTSTGVGVQVWNGATQLQSDNTSAKTSYTLTSGASPQVKTLQARVVQTTTAKPGVGTLNATGTLYVQYQ